ncbi:MAG: hypothetical protein ACJ77K_01105 [Bacteroidia bacterium]
MKYFLSFLLLLSLRVPAQELKLVKATKQTINSGASPSSTVNYLVELKKEKTGKWSVDSVVNVYTQKKVDYHIVWVNDPALASPDYRQVKTFSKKDKGTYQITFAVMKKRGSGRPGAPPVELTVPVAEFTQGAIIYYSMGKKRKQLKVESFDELETINAP